MSQPLILGGGAILIIIIIVVVLLVVTKTSESSPSPSPSDGPSPSSSGGGGTGCSNDNDCVGVPSGPLCDIEVGATSGGVCRPALAAGKCYNSGQCDQSSSNKYCYFPIGPDPVDGVGTCGECVTSSQCFQSGVGAGFCHNGQCVSTVPDIACTTNTDCEKHPQDKFVCHILPNAAQMSGTCSECGLENEDDDCSVFPDRPFCGAKPFDVPKCFECVEGNNCESGHCGSISHEGLCRPSCSDVSDCPPTPDGILAFDGWRPAGGSYDICDAGVCKVCTSLIPPPADGGPQQCAHYE